VCRSDQPVCQFVGLSRHQFPFETVALVHRRCLDCDQLSAVSLAAGPQFLVDTATHDNNLLKHYTVKQYLEKNSLIHCRSKLRITVYMRFIEKNNGSFEAKLFFCAKITL